MRPEGVNVSKFKTKKNSRRSTVYITGWSDENTFVNVGSTGETELAAQKNNTVYITGWSDVYKLVHVGSSGETKQSAREKQRTG